MTIKNLSIIAGLTKEDAIAGLKEYLKQKTEEGQILQSIFLVSGKCKDVHKIVLVNEKKKAQLVADLEVVFDDHIYSIIRRPTEEPIHQLEPNSSGNIPPVNLTVGKQLSITNFLKMKPECGKLARSKKQIKPSLKGKSSDKQLSIRSYLYKKQTYKPKPKWLEDLKLKFDELESSHKASMGRVAHPSQPEELLELNSSDDHYLNSVMEEFEMSAIGGFDDHYLNAVMEEFEMREIGCQFDWKSDIDGDTLLLSISSDQM